MKISIIITTHNRREELQRTLIRLSELRPPADEIVICADGCTDGTTEMVRSQFPNCVLLENETSRGSIYSRDRLLRASNNEIVASFDDDSYPIGSDFVGRVKGLFAQDSFVAVTSFPEISDNNATADKTKTPSSAPHLVSAYANCAAAMRRDVYLRSQGFPKFFGHMYEEPDYALQCYALGYHVRFEPTVPIHHHISAAQRDPMRRHHLNARNELWSVLMRCPFPQVIPVALFRIWRQFRYAWSEGLALAIREPLWWWSALRGVRICLRHRSPVVWRVYYAWMRLARYPVTSASQLLDKARAAA
jgi:GT2 family glycosyltransferase